MSVEDWNAQLQMLAAPHADLEGPDADLSFPHDYTNNGARLRSMTTKPPFILLN